MAAVEDEREEAAQGLGFKQLGLAQSIFAYVLCITNQLSLV